MNHFQRKKGVLHAEASRSSGSRSATARRSYVYSTATLDPALEGAAPLARRAPPPRLLRGEGELEPRDPGACSPSSGAGFDIVSGGELYRVAAGGRRSAQGRLLAASARRDDEIAFALEAGVRVLQRRERERARTRSRSWPRRIGVRAPIALRVNPDVDPKTHPYISTGLRENKFGVSVERGAAPLPLRRARPTRST